MLSEKGSVEEAKCEDLERVAVDNDPEKFFQVGGSIASSRKRRTNRISSKECRCVRMECL